MQPMSEATSSITCPQCTRCLLGAGLRLDDLVRCSICGAQFGVDRPKAIHDEQPAALSRLAIVSLALGVASALCLFFSGFPAIVAGILALKRIRKQPERLTGRGFAWAGIVTGSLFGLLCSGGLTTLLVLTAVRAKPNRDPLAVQKAVQAMGDFDIPAGYRPAFVSQPFFGMKLVVFREDRTGGNIMLHQYSRSLGPPLQHRRQFENFHSFRINATERLTIRVLGMPTEMIKQVGRDPSDRPRRRYLTAFPAGDYSQIIIVEDGDSPVATADGEPTAEPALTDEQVVRFLESFRLPQSSG